MADAKIEMDKVEKDLIILFEAIGNMQLPDDFLHRFHTHIFCQRGSIEFVFNDNSYKCKSGEFVFWFAFGDEVPELVERWVIVLASEAARVVDQNHVTVDRM